MGTLKYQICPGVTHMSILLPCVLERPLHIITGVGKHSAQRVGVLRPAILSVLEEEGWGKVTKLEGKIIVWGGG